jgi:pyocin large subunit-like protein
MTGVGTTRLTSIGLTIWHKGNWRGIVKAGIDRTNIYGVDESIIASGYAMSTDVERMWEQMDCNVNKAYDRGHHLGSTGMGEGHDNY